MASDLATNLIAAVLFALLGIVFLVAAFVVIDKLTPGDLWQHLIQDNNIALAIVVAGIVLGLSIIIAAAIH